MADDKTGTGTVRVRSDLIDMIRVICTHEREEDGTRVKAVEYIDSLLREPVTERYDAVMRRLVKQEADKRKKS